jgi:hypothetical protein
MDGNGDEYMNADEMVELTMKKIFIHFYRRRDDFTASASLQTVRGRQLQLHRLAPCSHSKLIA